MFGWTIQGPDLSKGPERICCLSTVVLQAYADESFKESYYWDLETIGIKNESSSSEQFSVADLNKYVWKNKERYCARLLWREEHSVLDSYREGAQMRFGSLVRKLLREPQRFLEYERAMNEFILNGVAERVSSVEAKDVSERLYYLPHRAVYREDKETTKVRIVFDASAHQGNNASLNALLSPGCNLLSDVLEMLLNFRLSKIGIVADIEKAFLQIELSENDRDSHRFFWFKNGVKDFNDLPPWEEYRMTRVTFGVACSPFLLSAIIRLHLEEEKSNFPEACSYLEHSFYMDLIFSVSDEVLAIKLYHGATNIMLRAPMCLRKWNSNSLKVKAAFDPESICPDMQKILGICWYTASDELMVDLEPVLTSLPTMNATKRNVLSLISKIFDPLGVLGPCLVKLKLLFQDTWKRKLDWDAPLMNDLLKRWTASTRDLAQLKSIAIPRCIQSITLAIERELHLFADASMQAYGAVAYVRCTNPSGKTEARYLCSKNRIAPIKGNGSPELTLPKLELTAALISVRLYTYLKDHFRLNFNKVIFWTDSQIALAWIYGDARKWKPYVAHRVQEIREKSDPQSWKHCAGEHNPADLLTRGISPNKLANSSLWLSGPEWLAQDYHKVASSSKGNSLTDIPSYLTCLLVDEDSLPYDSAILPIENYSSYRRLLRVTAYVMRFVRFILQRGKVSPGSPYLTKNEISIAERYWIKIIQQSEYAAEIISLKKRRPVAEVSKLRMLNPLLDASGILRVGTRLSEDNPVIIPRHSHLAKIIIMEIHQRMHHAGTNLILAEVRKHFWIPQARQLIKSLIRPCVICKRLRGKAASQPFAPLPRSRLASSRPFETTGVDFAGPLYIKETGGGATLKKCYIMLLTCAVVRAVHLELVPNLTTESCLMALRRFIARRGSPKLMLSDNAKTFKRAALELQELEKILKSEQFQGFACSNGFMWNFIVERAPWWGGFWERLIRSVKDVLKIAIGRSVLNAEQLSTLLAEVESIINSRPLTYISDDPLDLEPLTPANFLNGLFSTVAAEKPSSLDQDIRLKWKSRLRIINAFWKRFKTEYLQQLRSAHFAKTGASFTVSKGDVVLVHDNLQPRILWKLALVESTYPGRDGKVRACEVRCSNGSRIRRPVQLLYPLEISAGGGC